VGNDKDIKHLVIQPSLIVRESVKKL